MSTALVFYTNGTEDIEVTATVDVLDRGGVKISYHRKAYKRHY